MVRRYRTPLAIDVQKAKFAVRWDDETPTELVKLFPPNNDPDRFRGDKEDLSQIRTAMRRYERNGAEMREDKEFYDARFRMQFVEVNDDPDEN